MSRTTIFLPIFVLLFIFAPIQAMKKALMESVLHVLAQRPSSPNIQAHILALQAECYLFGCNGYPYNLEEFYRLATHVTQMQNLDDALLNKLERDIALYKLLKEPKITRNGCSGCFDFSDPHNGCICYHD